MDKWPYDSNSVFNAAAAEVDGQILLLCRVEDFRGISHFCTARSNDGINNWEIDQCPTLLPDPSNYPEELWGIEDPRITRLQEMGCWAVTYTAFSSGGPLVAIAVTEDFKSFKRLGAVMPPDDKDAALFPVRFNGCWAMLHRPVTVSTIEAHIWLSFSPDLIHWGQHREVLQARRGAWWDARKIGLCGPPLETDAGWLILYHGVRTTASGSIYRLGLALLDRENPGQVVRRSDEWIFGPREHYEREGDVDDVVFPCGWILRGGNLLVYYGAADSRLCLATARISEVMDYILNCPVNGDVYRV